MNREILFRGKDTENGGQWRYGNLLQYPEGNWAIVSFDKDGKGSSCDVDPKTIGQYVGLKDEYDEKIFEGDVLDYTVFDIFDNDHRHRGVVKWNDDGFVCDGCVRAPRVARIVGQSDAEIIGNVYDNPELV